MFASSICKHTNKWGKNKGNICGNPSRKKDSRCHKHRYRFLQFLNRIYISFKYMFDLKPKLIKNKKSVKELLKRKDFQNKLEYEKNIENENIKKNNNEKFEDYIERMDRYTYEILKIKEEKIVHRLIIEKLYEELNDIYRMGTSEWTVCSNLILLIKRKYNFF